MVNLYGFPGGWLSGKESTYQCRNQEAQVQSLDRGNPLEQEMAPHFSILA